MSRARMATVIGGGLIGCCSAYYLARCGWIVTLLERDSIGAGASHGNCGYICPSHALPLSGPGVVSRTLPQLFNRDAPLAIPPRFDPKLWGWLNRFRGQCTQEKMMHAAKARNALLASSMQLYRELIRDEALDCQWRDNGLLLVFQSKREYDEYGETAELLGREFGIQTVGYAGDDVQRFEPTLRSGMAGGWHFPDDAHVRPDRLMAALHRLLLERGVTIREGVKVESIDVRNGKAVNVQTQAGVEEADLFVVAAGAEASRFASELGCRIPIQPGKGYSITTAPLKTPPTTPMIFETHHVAVTPFADGFRIGSTMEFTGFDRSLNPKRLNLLRKSAAEHLCEPLPDAELETWAGWRPMVYDGLPCIGPAPGASNVVVAAGNGMIGLATATGTGKLVAELASDDPPHIDPAPYRLSRF